MSAQKFHLNLHLTGSLEAVTGQRQFSFGPTSVKNDLRMRMFPFHSWNWTTNRGSSASARRVAGVLSAATIP
jgi:hypothetical protein